MNWNILKDKIYFWDGSWRDVYVKNTTTNDWNKWVEFVNEKYRVDFYNGKIEKNDTKIDFKVVSEYWNGNHDLCSTAKVFINDIQINSHFFDNTEIENDIDPREFKSIENHNVFIDYLKGVSNLLDKEVIVTPENCPEIVLIRVRENLVQISIESEPPKWQIRTKE